MIFDIINGILGLTFSLITALIVISPFLFFVILGIYSTLKLTAYIIYIFIVLVKKIKLLVKFIFGIFSRKHLN